MNHGFWSMFHTIGWDNKIWIDRLKKIGMAWSTVVIALFVAQAIVFTVQSHKKHYTTDEALLYQYAQINPEYAPVYVEYLAQQAQAPVESFINEYQQAAGMAQMFNNDTMLRTLFIEKGDSIVNVFKPIAKRMEGISAAEGNEVLMQVPAIINFVRANKSRLEAQAQAEEQARQAQEAARQAAQPAVQAQNETNN